MAETRSPEHVALYDSAYIILFDDSSWSSRGLSDQLVKKLKRSKHDIKFVSLGPDDQWFYRLANGKVYYNIEDENLRNEAEESTASPYKLWFNTDDGYILQYDDLSLFWDGIPLDFHNKLNGRQKSLPKVKNLTFGANETWWVSFEDNTARRSLVIPFDINQCLPATEFLALDPVDETNYFLIENNGDFKWRVNDDFDDDINEDNDIRYIDPQNIRYTQASISGRFTNGESIESLRQDLENGVLSVHEIPTIDIIKTRSGNMWSLNNRRLWCFRHAHNIDRIPVRVVEKQPSWFNKRIQRLQDPFHIHVRGSSEETDSSSSFNDSNDY